MSGEDIKAPDVKAHAGAAEGTASAHDPEEVTILLTSKNRGAKAAIPRTRAEAAAIGSESLRERTRRRVRRTAELTAQDHTLADIGRIIASEEGQPAAFPKATVKGWRRLGRGPQP